MEVAGAMGRLAPDVDSTVDAIEVEGPQLRVHPVSALPSDLRRDWAALAGDAAEPNPFLEAWFAEAGLQTIAGQENIRIATVVNAGGRLDGLLPLRIAPRYGRVPVRHVSNWQHPNMFLGAPLVRRGQERRFWRALLESLDHAPWAPGFLHLSGLAEGDTVHQALAEACAERGRPCDVVLRQIRPLAQPTGPLEEYHAANVPSKRRAELRRKRRRLEELGRVETRALSSADEADDWSAAFVALERSGWKGRAGSALGCDGGTDRFFREVLREAAKRGRLQFLRLDLDGQPIAMQTSLLSRPGAFGFKACFDEAYARFSPGLLLQTDALLDHWPEGIAWHDSCSADDHPVSALWSEQRTNVRVTVPLAGFRRACIHRGARLAENGARLLRRAVGQ